MWTTNPETICGRLSPPPLNPGMSSHRFLSICGSLRDGRSRDHRLGGAKSPENKIGKINKYLLTCGSP